MGRDWSRRKPPRFSTAEIKKMEKMFLEAKDERKDRNFYQSFAKKINLASTRTGNNAINWKQVQRWLQSKQKHYVTRASSTGTVSKGLGDDPGNSNPECMSEVSEREGDRQEMEFEARSSKDGGCATDVPYEEGVCSIDSLSFVNFLDDPSALKYDVSEFLSHRFQDSGEVESLVRYENFGPDEDEWVVITKAIRPRSIAIESDECHKVAVGDHVICFREKNDLACYFDAHVMEIQRRTHDVRGCRCIFLIKYDDDQDKETARLDRLCRRP